MRCCNAKVRREGQWQGQQQLACCRYSSSSSSPSKEIKINSNNVLERKTEIKKETYRCSRSLSWRFKLMAIMRQVRFSMRSWLGNLDLVLE